MNICSVFLFLLLLMKGIQEVIVIKSFKAKTKLNYKPERERNIGRTQTRWEDDFWEEGTGQRGLALYLMLMMMMMMMKAK